MEESTKTDLKEFFKICYDRLDKGQEMYGSRYEHLDLFEEMSQELADIANYAFLEYRKIKALKKKAKSLEASQEKE
jgi:hypothetical protein